MQWHGVFISSTCYDLIDVRAELEVAVRDLGLAPVMSDRATSDFDVNGVSNSISTCLENVKKCETFVCILNNRYGPRLGKCGFDDISATHLEYRTALAARRRILVYARDRLLGEHSVWKKRSKDQQLPPPHFAWVQPDQVGIFEMLDEHQELTHGQDPNWVWPFRDSVELKTRLSADLGAASRRARLSRLVEQERIPLFALETNSSSRSKDGTTVSVQVSNVGSIVALDVELGLQDDIRHLAKAMTGHQTLIQKIVLPVAASIASHRICLRYSAPSGGRIEQAHIVNVLPSGACSLSAAPRQLRLLEAPAFEIE